MSDVQNSRSIAEGSLDVPAQQMDAQVLREQHQTLHTLQLQESLELALPRYLPPEIKQEGKSL